MKKFELIDLEWRDEISECPVYRPSKDDFHDPFDYIQHIAPHASKYGICKIVCPISPSVSADVVLTKEMKEFKFETTLQPLRLASWDANDKINFFTRGRKYKYREFESMANKAYVARCAASFSCAAALEKEFWREMFSGKKRNVVEYAINVEASAFSSHPNDHFGKSNWNLKNVSWLPKSSLRFLERSIPGITDPMLYIGMLFSMFAWHVEDHYLYSINYHHSGAPKTWYGVSADFALQFEKLVLDHVYSHDILSEDSQDGASKLLAEKTTMFPPNILLRNNVPVYKALQMPGEFVITFPRAYHAGFSHGFNCGEAVNFAIGDWFPFGAEAGRRYALLRVVPVIPYEQLLCKEAISLYKSLKHEGLHHTAVESASHLSIKLSFVQLFRSYEHALRHSSNFVTGPSSVHWPMSQETVICSICKRDCYLAYMICSACCSNSICLNHVMERGREWTDCWCGSGSKWTLIVREDMSAYKDAAQTFEQDKQISETNGSSVDNNCLQRIRTRNHEHGSCSEAHLDRKGKSNDVKMRRRRMGGLSQIHSKL